MFFKNFGYNLSPSQIQRNIEFTSYFYTSWVARKAKQTLWIIRQNSGPLDGLSRLPDRGLDMQADSSSHQTMWTNNVNSHIDNIMHFEST